MLTGLDRLEDKNNEKVDEPEIVAEYRSGWERMNSTGVLEKVTLLGVPTPGEVIPKPRGLELVK